MTCHFIRLARIWVVPFIILLVSSCNNQSIMFRAKRGYPYNELSKIENLPEYKIGVNDKLSISVTTNRGAILIEPTSGTVGSNTSHYESTVEFDGTIKMPLLGRVKVQELSVRECELLFEEQYKLFYVEPFAQVDIINKRVIIFPGVGGAASVVILRNKNTSLLEVIASTGGIRANARANRIKLIRGDLNNPQVYKIKLNKIADLKYAGIILQGNDIIYVEPRNDVVLNFVARVSPYIGVLNLGLLIYTLLPGK